MDVSWFVVITGSGLLVFTSTPPPFEGIVTSLPLTTMVAGTTKNAHAFACYTTATYLVEVARPEEFEILL